MTQGITIRPILEPDAGPVSRLLRATGWFEHMAAESPETTELRTRRALERCIGSDGHSILIAEAADKTVVGYVSVHWHTTLFLARPEGFVSEVFVVEANRGVGIGRELLQAVAHEASRRNCSRLILLTNVDRESYKRGFYSKLGWNERSNIANFVLEL